MTDREGQIGCIDTDTVIVACENAICVCQIIEKELMVFASAIKAYGEALSDWLDKNKDNLAAIEKCIDGDDFNE